MLKLKGKRKLLELHVDNGLGAAASEEAGVDIFTSEVDAKLPLIRAGAPLTFIQAGLLHGAVASAEEGVRKRF